MAAPPTLPSLAAQLATLQEKVAALQSWADTIVALAGAREKRIADLEARISELAQSDVASGWAKWRDNQKTEGGT
jgi:hypothetical protein